MTEQFMIPGLRCQNSHTECGIRKRLFHFAHKHKNILGHRTAIKQGNATKSRERLQISHRSSKRNLAKNPIAIKNVLIIYQNILYY
ncbi:hypothetical protein A2635_02050 [Candidatus Peribacteria bacterium RIFCSPHIGHO2_01_FULL_51_9]|nr:MAG: hypothetical protein A2635_02050 [Candidatus Peribacteria bacterium RIFCSPHIGHO2_01_FULL_51_9]